MEEEDAEMIIGCDACDWKSDDLKIEIAIWEAQTHVEAAHGPQPWTRKVETIQLQRRAGYHEITNMGLKLQGCKE